MITQEYLRECFDYDPDSGVVTWKQRPLSHFSNENRHKGWNTQYAGKVVGYVRKFKRSKTSYLSVKLMRKDYLLHRLIYLMVYGVEPEIIDHADGDGLNNAINNIRNVDRKTNNRNMPLNSKNKSGFIGVSWASREGKWKSQIRYKGRQVHLGYFEEIDDAIAARQLAEKEHGFHENHGR